MEVRLFDPKRWVGRGGVVVAALISVFAIAGAGAGAASAASTSKCTSPSPVTLMDVVSVDFTQETIMQRDGIDKAYCLNIQTQTVQLAGTIAEAVASGQVDAGYIGSGQIASAISQNLNVRVLMPLEVATAANNGFFASASSGIKSVKDLAGKTVGLISLGSAAQAALEIDLQKGGVNPSSVKMEAYPFPSMGTGILSGQLAAGQLAEPFLSQTKAKGGLTEVAPTYSVFGPHAPTTYYIVNGTWAATHKSLVARLQQALAQGILKATRYPNEILNLTQEQDPALTPAVLKAQEPPMFTIDPEFASLSLQWADMYKLGMLTATPPKPYGVFVQPGTVPGASQNVLWDTAPGETVDGASGTNDRILGYLSHDRLIGGPGNDIIIAAGGDAKITAGSGNDTIVARVGKNTVTCGKGHDTVYATKADTLRNCKTVKYTAAPQALLKAFGYGAGGSFPN
jgi:ABC-type nitrate/sulfonate/bicarbonate transport system substrate-binding protein